MKKLLIVLMAVVVFLLPLSFTYNVQVSAAGGKVVSLAAKKAAKELVVDSALNYVGNLALDYAFDSKDYKTDSGFKLVCLEGGKKDTCSNPVQVKANPTASEKKQLDNVVELVLDEKAGTTGWKKWLDLVVPVFAIGLAGSYINTALDPDTESLFDQIAKEALIRTNLLKPVTPSVPILPTPTTPPTPVEGGNTSGQTIVLPKLQPTIVSYDISYKTAGDFTSNLEAGYYLHNSSLIFEFEHNSPRALLTYLTIIFQPFSFQTSLQGSTQVNLVTDVSNSGLDYHNFNGIMSYRPQYSYINQTLFNRTPEQLMSISKVVIRNKTEHGATSLMTTIYYENGDVMVSQSLPNANPAQLGNNVQLNLGYKDLTNYQAKFKISVYPESVNTGYVPFNPDIYNIPTHTTDSSIFKKPDGTVQIIPIDVIPITTPDGLPVIPGTVPGTWIRPDGTPVPDVNEDTLIVGDPVKDPDGNYIPVTGTDPLPKPEPAPKPEEPVNEDPPDKNTERDKLKDESESLATLLTTRFPFSLPWDFLAMMRLLYAEPMTPSWQIKGTEKIPMNFKIDLKFMDPYAPWFRGFILAGFVMSVIFMHSRFMGGSK